MNQQIAQYLIALGNSILEGDKPFYDCNVEALKSVIMDAIDNGELVDRDTVTALAVGMDDLFQKLELTGDGSNNVIPMKNYI